MNDRKCLECDEQLRGRIDRKFCSDQCRITHNNRQHAESNTVIRSINRILRKNYSILTMLNSQGKTTTSKNDLQKKGYRFDYFTFAFTNNNSHINYFCYDHGYREQENDKVVLVRREINEDLSSPRA